MIFDETSFQTVKKAVITHLNIRKTGFLSGIILGTLGLITGIADAFFNGVNDGLFAPASAFLLPKLGMWGVVLLPLICFSAGFFLGALIAWLFNLAGKLTGGVDIEIIEKL
jgi:hypothetical protein